MQPIEEQPVTQAEETGPDAETVAAIEADEAEETAPFEADEQPFKGKHIFISHKCDAEQDDTIAAMLHRELTKLGCDVYFDKAQPLGARYDEAIGDSLKKADFVVALLSQHTNESDWVKFELDYAYAQFQLHGRPTILPVGLELSVAEVSMRIGARVAGFNARSYDPSDYEEILADVKASISHEPRVHERIGVGMEGFLVRKFRRNIMRAACLNSPELRRAGEMLEKTKLLWVVGDVSLGTHFARSLAVNEHDREIDKESKNEQGQNIYEVPKSVSWSKVADQLVANSIIIFLDVNPSLLFDEESPRDELKSLKRLSERNHVIVTTATDSYAEIEQEMRNRDFEGGAHFAVSHNLYNERARLEIFERLVALSYESNVITHRQQQWARGLLEESESREMFRTIINKWSPADIERFVTRHLPEVKKQGDIRKVLQRNADLDNEIHTWFVALDDSTRCFVLAVAMLSGLRKEPLWENYKLIVQRLKELDGNLSLWPLGIGRQRAALYVTTEGQVDFIDDRIAEAIYQEISKNFREYLIELREVIQEVSVPKDREKKPTKELVNERKIEAAKSKDVRVALARVAGKAGRQGLGDLTKLLNFWGTDSVLAVREAVALCLEEAVAERTGAEHALALMERWCNDTSNGDDAFFRRLTAASALASIMVATRGRDVYERAIGLLDRLAISDYASIKFYVSISLKKTGRKVPLVDKETPVSLSTLLTLVARDVNPKTKINVAETLIESRIADETKAIELIREWLSGEDSDCRWVAMCSLLLWRKQENEARNREFAGFLTLDAQTGASVLIEVLNQKHQKMPIFWQAFKQLVRKADEATRKALVSGMAGLTQASLDDKLWPLLRASAEPVLSGLVSEVRAEKWRRMFPTPAEFIVDLATEVHQEHSAGEVYAAVARLLKPEPEGYRSEFVQTLVNCFPERRAILDDILKRLTIIAPQVFEALSIEIRSEGFKKLFDDPLTFISVISDSLRDAEISGETSAALESLAQPEPRGNREKMLQTLTAAQTLDVAALRALLWQLRATGSTTLSALSYEFNLHALESDLSQPERFLSRVTEAMRDPKERAEVLQLLKQLSMAGPHGRRRTLIQALGVSRVTRPAEVDALLYDTSWQTSAGLIRLSTEVKLFSFLSRIFSPRFVSKVFAPQP